MASAKAAGKPESPNFDRSTNPDPVMSAGDVKRAVLYGESIDLGNGQRIAVSPDPAYAQVHMLAEVGSDEAQPTMSPARARLVATALMFAAEMAEAMEQPYQIPMGLTEGTRR